MKIHFMGPIDGNKERYKRIISRIEELGHEVVTKHSIERKMSDIVHESDSDTELMAKKLERWIRQADLIMFEVTRQEVSIGYEIATAINMMKPVIVLYEDMGKNVPHGLKGIKSDRVQVHAYSEETLDELIELAIDYAGETADVRFNFFITPSIGRYLDWVAQQKKLPRSVYLRNLIELDMERNDEYRRQAGKL